MMIMMSQRQLTNGNRSRNLCEGFKVLRISSKFEMISVASNNGGDHHQERDESQSNSQPYTPIMI